MFSKLRTFKLVNHDHLLTFKSVHILIVLSCHLQPAANKINIVKHWVMQSTKQIFLLSKLSYFFLRASRVNSSTLPRRILLDTINNQGTETVTKRQKTPPTYADTESLRRGVKLESTRIHLTPIEYSHTSLLNDLLS